MRANPRVIPVAEEPRFFVRIALYTGGIGVVYWFVSYEAAGSLLLAFLFGGAAFGAAAAGALVRARRRERGPGEGPLDAVERAVGFAQHPGDERSGPLELVPEALPPNSIWPPFAAAAMLLIGLGLIYGAWFYLPGACLAGVAAWRWTTELGG